MDVVLSAGQRPAVLEATLAAERFEKKMQRDLKDAGFEATSPVLKLTETLLPRMIEAIRKALEGPVERGLLSRAVEVLKGLSVEKVALCTLGIALRHIAVDAHVRNTSEELGNLLNDELFHNLYQQIDPRTLAAAERRVKRKFGSVKGRKKHIKRILESKGKVKHRYLSMPERVKVGGWLLAIMLETFPEVFQIFEVKVSSKRSAEKMLTLTDEALDQIDAIAEKIVHDNPALLPDVEEPPLWDLDTAIRTSNYKIRLVRSPYKETQAAVKQAVESGQMRPAMDALNTIQSVPYVINTAILEVQEACWHRGIDVSSLPRKNPESAPPRPVDWDFLSEAEQRAWKIEAAAKRDLKRSLVGQNVCLAADLAIASYLKQFPAFWSMHSFDWRGRVYPLSHFNFQRSDNVRALFLFRDGQPIGERGLWWLKVHTANCGDFDKVSKKSFEDRVAWVDQNINLIRFSAQYPMEALWWTSADKPFLFLAACMELVAALDVGPEYITHLPVSWDGSCSGLQHLCAMSRAEEGALVNLTASDTPQDIYNKVAEVTKCAIASDASEPELVEMCLAYGVDRKLVKRNVMTYAYSVTAWGMKQQHMTETMDPLRRDVLLGNIEAHPFGEDNGRKASAFIAAHTHRAIEAVVRKPAEVMTFLQQLAKALAHEGKPLTWVTPVGIPWVNRYHDALVQTVRLWLYDRGVKLRYQTHVATGEFAKDVNKTKAANGVAPNFVHACDGAHLCMVVNAAAAEGITNLALVHDSFGCLAPQSDSLHRIIREQFVRMYSEHDVLVEVLAQAKCDLTVDNHHRLPNAVEYGTLNLEGVLQARYAFA